MVSVVGAVPGPVPALPVMASVPPLRFNVPAVWRPRRLLTFVTTAPLPLSRASLPPVWTVNDSVNATGVDAPVNH